MKNKIKIVIGEKRHVSFETDYFLSKTRNLQIVTGKKKNPHMITPGLKISNM